jgi:hypothetical protein
MKEMSNEEYWAQWGGLHVCPQPKCKSEEVPLSTMEHEEGTDYFFSCAVCHWSWYVAVYNDGSEPVANDAGWFYGEEGKEE